MVNEPEFVDDLFRERALLDIGERERAKAKWREEFRLEINSSDLPCCILSSEHLQSRLRTPAEVTQLKRLLDDIFEQVTLVLYIREPVATAVSLYSTAVKYGALNAELPGPNAPYCRRIVNHAETIRLWTSVFGEQNIRVRIFAADAFAGRDLLDDFIEACELPDGEYLRPAIANESLSALGIAIMRRVNKQIRPVSKDGTANRKRAGMAEFFARHFSAGPRYVPPQKMVDAYNEAFEESNEWVRSKFFPDKAVLFWPYRTPQSKGNQLSDDEMQCLADAIVELWNLKTTT